MLNLFNQGHETTKLKEFIHIGSLVCGVFFFLFGLILPMPFYEGKFTIFNDYDYNTNKYTWLISKPEGLICFVLLMFSWIIASIIVFKATKTITWKDLKAMIFKMQNLIPIAISSTLLEMIRELETMTKQERKLKQAEYAKRINETITDYKINEGKLMAETLKMLEIEKQKNKDIENKAKQWDAINKKVEEEL